MQTEEMFDFRLFLPNCPLNPNETPEANNVLRGLTSLSSRFNNSKKADCPLNPVLLSKQCNQFILDLHTFEATVMRIDPDHKKILDRPTAIHSFQMNSAPGKHIHEALCRTLSWAQLLHVYLLTENKLEPASELATARNSFELKCKEFLCWLRKVESVICDEDTKDDSQLPGHLLAFLSKLAESE